MDALVYGVQGLRRAETMSANECRAMLEMAGVSYPDRIRPRSKRCASW